MLCACQSGLDDPAPLGPLDEPFFRCQVQPVLTKSCAGFRCHGTGDRYYVLFARNRLRLGGTEAERNATMRDSERAFNYNASVVQLDLDSRNDSFLLLKPLDQSAGGYWHGGAEEYGMGDVFLSRDERDFKTLEAWVMGAKDDPACQEPGSNL